MNTCLLLWLLFRTGPHHCLTIFTPAHEGYGYKNLYSRGMIWDVNGRFWFVSAEGDTFGKLIKYRPPSNTLFAQDVGGRLRDVQGKLLQNRTAHIYFYHLCPGDSALFIVPMPIPDDGLESWDE